MYRRSSNICVIFMVLTIQLLILAVRIIPFISVIIILVSSTIFFKSFTILCISIITSIPFNILWYNLVQSSLSLSLLLVPGLCCLISLRYRGWGKRKLLYSCCYSGKTCFLCCCSSLSEYFGYQNGILPPLFIDFDSNTLSNSLLLPLLHEATLFQLSIDCVHPHSPSNAPSTASLSLVFNTF